MSFDRFKCFRALRQAPVIAVTVACSLALVACGGGGGGGDSGAGGSVSRPAELSLVVGSIETFNGTGAKVRISQQRGIAIDSVGNTYITETGLHSVRKITPTGVVSVYAGDALNAGSADGSGAAARFANPGAMAVDKDDNIYVLHYCTVRKVSPAGQVTTLAGSPDQCASVDGKGNAARFDGLSSIAVDPTGSVFVLEGNGSRRSGGGVLRKIAVDGTVTTLAVPADTFRLDVRLAADASGNLFIASGTVPWEFTQVSQGPAPLLHKLTPAGVLTQVYAFSRGDVDGAIYNFGGIAADGVGNVYLSNGTYASSASPDSGYTSIGNTVLKLSPQGVLSTIAGTRGKTGFTDGPGLDATFDKPGSIAVDRQGNLVVADVGNGTVRRVSSGAVVSTLAGRAPDSVDGQGDNAQLKDVRGLASDQRGNVLVAEYSALRKLSPSGMLTTTRRAFGGFINLALDSQGFAYATDSGGFFTSTYQYAPSGTKTGKKYVGSANSLAVDAQDNLYRASMRSIDNLTSGKTLANDISGYITAFVFDSIGNAYAADDRHSVILKITPAGTVSILAGMADNPGYKDGAAGTAQFNSPTGIAVLGTDIFVSDTGNNLIRKISQDGVVTTIAGTPGSLDTVMGQTGSLYRPTALATESSNSLLVVADGKAVVRIRVK